MRTKLRAILYKVSSALVSALYLAATAQYAAGYASNQIVPDVRQSVAMSGGSACPVRAHQRSGAFSISLRWSTTLGTSPVSILTQNQTAAALLTEILRPCFGPDSRDGAFSWLQPLRCVERHDVSLRARAGHL